MTRSRDTANIIPTVDAKGDLLVGTANNEIDNLTAGTNGTYLKANSASATGLEWATGVESIVDAKGDLLVGTADNTVDNLSPGTNGQFLTANSATTTGLEWTTPASTGNAIINGAMAIAQRGAGSGTGSGRYPVDRFFIEYGAGTYTTERATDGPINVSPYSLKVTATTPGTRNAADYYQLIHNLEGKNVMQFSFGSSGASTITISFWVKSSVTGSYSGTLSSGSNLKCFAFTYTISSANTWERKTVTIPGDTAGGAGAYPINNTTGLRLRLSLGNGTDYDASSTGSWLTETNKTSVAGSVGWAQTSGATFFLTGVQLEAGPTATPFRGNANTIQGELAACQRYYERIGTGTIGRISAATIAEFYLRFNEKRAVPTFSLTSTSPQFYDPAVGTKTGTASTITSVVGPTVNGHVVQISGFTGLVTGNFAIMVNANFIEVIAEL